MSFGELMMQFLVGLGAGGATFVRQLSAWTLGSIGGFSNASSRVLARALQTQPAARCYCAIFLAILGPCPPILIVLHS